MAYVFMVNGREVRTIAGPGVATDSTRPDYPRELMAVHLACTVCWRDCQPGESVYACDNGRPVHAHCAEWSVAAIKTAGDMLAYCPVCGGEDRPHTHIPTDYPHSGEAYACNDCGRESIRS